MALELIELLDEQDARDLRGNARPAVRVNHLGSSDRTVREVFDAVSALPTPAVRSGHVGNWREIWRGQVGLVDYNRYICRDLRLGVPLLHAHTFTENRDFSTGDTIYLPGARITGEVYERLPLFIKDGTDFHPVPEHDSVCCAFTYVHEGGRMTPLLSARADEIREIPGAMTIPTLLTQDEDLLRRTLRALLDAALDDDNGLTLEQLLGSSVSRQGQRGSAPRAVSGGFDAEGTWYESPRTLVDAAVQALRYGSADHDGIHDHEQRSGEYLPLLGATALLVLTAYHDCYRSGSDVHTHWGAISMSGYPPLSQGYFARRATRKTARSIGEALRSLPEFRFDLRFALLPAPVLSLLAPAEFETDRELVEGLLDTVISTTEPPTSDPNPASEHISRIVRNWLQENRENLSDYYLNRFGLARSVFNGTDGIPQDGTPAALSRLNDLTMRQASMVLGALMTHLRV